jgi:hypothetical protein
MTRMTADDSDDKVRLDPFFDPPPMTGPLRHRGLRQRWQDGLQKRTTPVPYPHPTRIALLLQCSLQQHALHGWYGAGEARLAGSCGREAAHGLT